MSHILNNFSKERKRILQLDYTYEFSFSHFYLVDVKLYPELYYMKVGEPVTTNFRQTRISQGNQPTFLCKEITTFNVNTSRKSQPDRNS